MRLKRVLLPTVLAAVLLLILSMNVAIETFAQTKDVPRMSKEELRARLNDPDVIVIDARSGRDWRASEFKIAGAKREDPENISWTGKYPKDKTLVIYCA